MYNPQESDFSTWVKNQLANLQEEHQEKPALFVYIDVHESKDNMPGEHLFSWRGEVENVGQAVEAERARDR